MKKNLKKQDDDLETLIEKGFKTYHAPPSTKPRCFNVLVGATVFLLWLLIMAIIMIIRSSDTSPIPKAEIAFKSFIEKSSNTHLGTIANDIVKPIIDKKTYRGLQLPNGMKIMMISDPDSLQASAAVNVKVGSFADPAEMGGLAHFCEHMVFMESEKYPELNGFQKFVSNYDGDTNAFTKPEDTNYYFQTTSSGFEEALSRFSHFFISPIFTEDLMKQEVSSIDGELNKNLNDDGWRLRFLLQITSNPESVLYKFTTGSSDALMTVPQENGLDVVAKLQGFFDKYYSANLMSLVVNYDKPIDEIETLVRKVFTDVPNKNSEAPSYEKDPGPYTGKYANKLIQYSPVNPSDSLQLIFSVKPNSDHPFLEPYSFISQILLDKDQGGLSKHLSDAGLGDGIIAGLVLTSSKFDVFLIEVQMTEMGLRNIPEITKRVFSYLDLVAEKGITEELYNQYAKINNYTFNYIPDENDVMDTISSIASNLQAYPLKYGISGSKVANKFNKEVLTEYVRQLNVDNLMMFVASPDFEVSKDITDTFKLELLETTSKKKNTGKLKKASDKLSFTELNLFNSLYGIHYNVADIPTALLDELREASHTDHPDMKMPDANQFVPKQFDLVEKACSKGSLKCTQNYEADALQTKPNKIYEDEYVRVWHQLDRSSGTPMVIGDIVLYNEEVQKDIIASTLASLRVELIKSLLEEKLYEIGLSGNSVDITTTGFKIEAFEDVFLDLMSTVLKQYKHFDFTEEQFNDAKNMLISRIYYGMSDSPYMNLVRYKSRLLLEYNFLDAEVFNVANEIEFQDFKELIKEFDSFPLYSEVLFMGNILDSEAKKFGEKVVKSLDYLPSQTDKKLENRVLDITGKNLVFRSYAPVGDGNENFILNTYQSGIMNPERMCYLNLLVNLMEMEVYTYIRTEQQMCYIVQTFPDKTKNILNLNILVQSSTLNPNEIDGHIEIALGRTEKRLKSLTDEEFETLVESFRQSMSDKSTTLHEKAEGYLNHIVNGDYVFNQREKVLGYLPNVTKKGLLSYFNNLVKKPNKLSIQFYNESFKVLPTDTLPKEKQLSKTEAVLVSDGEILSMVKRFPTHIEFDL